VIEYCEKLFPSSGHGEPVEPQDQKEFNKDYEYLKAIKNYLQKLYQNIKNETVPIIINSSDNKACGKIQFLDNLIVKNAIKVTDLAVLGDICINGNVFISGTIFVSG